jgi:group I intron endonuclease
MGYIYLVTNKVNGKQYVGQTICDDIEKRWKCHKNVDKNTLGRYLYNAYTKHGIENFDFKVICVCFDEDCDRYEEDYIQKFGTIVPDGYNLRAGGNNSKHHPETLKKMSEALKGRKPPPITEETRKKKSESMKGIKNPNYGKPMSEEQKKKLSDSHKARKFQRNDSKPIVMHSNSLKNLDKGRQSLRREVSQYSIEGVFIAKYKNLTEAANAVNGSKSSINKVCNENNLKYTSHKGYIWKYSDGRSTLTRPTRKLSEETKQKIQEKRNLSVMQYNETDQYIATFLSIKLASEQTRTNAKSISSVCKGKQKTAGGFKWKYA